MNLKRWSVFAGTLVIILVAVLIQLVSSSQASPAMQQSPRSRHPDPAMEQVPFLDPQPEQPQPASPDEPSVPIVSWSRLVFQSLRDGDWEIYAADGNGSNEIRLTDNKLHDIHPRLNRGCTRIVFAAEDGPYYQIYVMNADGSGRERITEIEGNVVHPAWSPDGTQIAYQSYQDGQAEIYVMNADGSNPTRLTWDGSYDGEPIWSPDGTQIAFTSSRAGHYHIWAMDTDGSNQRQLSTQPYSENPTWSPDGSKIAYDSDEDADGWQELWLMSYDGKYHQEILDVGSHHWERDAWARSWSPDGRYLAFTLISWKYYQGIWYWLDAYLYVWDQENPLMMKQLADDDTAWRPDLQSIDVLAPSSSMEALPFWSTGPFSVSWTTGPDDISGFRSFDVQVRDGPAGSWENWLFDTAKTSDSYPGIGGHTYYFRSRARDNAFNVEDWPADDDVMTRVEASSPRTAITPLAPFSRPDLLIRWGGIDPGGSGIQSYDIQYRDVTGGTWTDWLTTTTETSAHLTGISGQTYAFRSRAVDRAQNVEAWPGGEGDTQTTIYDWRVEGNIRDNSGVPVAGAVVTTSPEGFLVVPSNAEGAFGAYGVGTSGVGLVTWGKAGYGSLPDTDFTELPDLRWDVTLPPADNIVADWGFESGSLSPAWHVEGKIVPLAIERPKHTGDYAAQLGCRPDGFALPSNLSDMTSLSEDASIAIDSEGIIHVVWYESGTDLAEIFYTQRQTDGTWSSPENVSNTSEPSNSPRLVVDSEGVVHLVYLDHSPGKPHLFYITRTQDGSWTARQSISTPGSLASNPTLAADQDGTLHVAWIDETNQELRYTSKESLRDWSAPLLIDEGYGLRSPHIATDHNRAVHLAWEHDHDIYYIQKTVDGEWLAIDNISNLSYRISTNPKMVVEKGGRVHVAWLDDRGGYSGAYNVFYTARRSDGTWTEPENVSNLSSPNCSYPEVQPDGHGGAHVAWQRQMTSTATDIFYAGRKSDGTWSTPLNVSDRDNKSSRPNMVVGPNGIVHLAWSDELYLGGYREIAYAQLGLDGTWSAIHNISNTSGTSDYPRLVLEANGLVHAMWLDHVNFNFDVFYAGPPAAGQTGNSILSQIVSIPSTVNSPTLSFLYQLGGTHPASNTWLDIQVDDGLAASSVFSSTQSSKGWSQQWADLTPWAGQTVTLTWNVHQEAAVPCTWAFLDEVSLGSTYPDLWLNKNGLPETARPGQNLTFYLQYGNRGGAVAEGVRLTDSLPAELVFVTASPAPLTSTPALVWNLGNVPARSEAYTIVITASVSLTTPLGSYVANTARIGTEPELETANNEAQAPLFVGQRIYLPLLPKEHWALNE